MRARFCSVLLAATLIVSASACRESKTPAVSAKPSNDIILLTIDTWRADAARFAGNTAVETPFLDSIAARSIVFTNAHAQNVITLPSHANILTGLNPFQHGVRENAGYVLRDDVVTLAERLKALGYATGAFVGAFPLDRRFGLAQGFDVYDDNYGKGRATIDFSLQERPAPRVLEPATQWWRSQEGHKRFLWIHVYDLHAPYRPPEPYASLYRDRNYLGEIAAVDAALQRYLAPIVTNDTTLVITGDHGEALGDHGERTHGLFAYESTLKIPLLVAGPRVTPHKEARAVQHIDIVPTVLDAAGAPPVAELPGQSLLGDIQPRDTYFESLSSMINRGWAPLTGLIRNDNKFIELPIAELYELDHDPGELKNVYTERRREVAAARETLAKFDTTPAPPSDISREEVERLRSLGYFSGSSGPAHKVTAADDPKNLVHLEQKMHAAIDAFQNGRKAESVRIMNEVLAERPGMGAARELLATMLQESDRVPEAIAVLQQLVRDGESSDSTKVQLALLLNETGRPNEAAALLAPFVPTTRSADVLSAYGAALADQGKLQEAAAQFKRALELDPNSALAMQNLGIAALQGNDVATAQTYLTRALALNPRLPLALNTMGFVYARANNFPAAIDSWKKAVALDGRQYDALFNIGVVAFRTGDRENARSALEQFVRTAPPARYGKDIAAAREALQRLR
jgi:arylsulfatase A-like enzyme/tetratricopeptide (TPR) repeat protein